MKFRVRNAGAEGLAMGVAYKRSGLRHSGCAMLLRAGPKVQSFVSCLKYVNFA